MNRYARLAMATAVAAALLITAGCNKLKARDQLNKGVVAYKNSKYEDAIEHFKNAVTLDGDLKVAKLYLATAYAQQYVPGVDTPDNNANAQQAIEYYKAVLSNDPKNVTSLKGLAFLYMNMKKLDDSRDYYRKTIDADPNDPEAYYSVAVIDWTAAYKDTAERKGKVGLKVDDPLNSKKDQKLCQEIASADAEKVDDGIKMLDIAMQKRADYDDAMTYMNLLYRRKADMACNNPQEAADALKQSNEWSDKAMATRKKKADEAAKKVAGGIVLDQKKPAEDQDQNQNQNQNQKK